MTGTTTTMTLTLWVHDSSSGGPGVACSTTNSNIMGGFQKMAPDSYIAFGWDANGTCTTFNNGMGSDTEPKKLVP